jgi:hypothetical protein
VRQMAHALGTEHRDGGVEHLLLATSHGDGHYRSSDTTLQL